MIIHNPNKLSTIDYRKVKPLQGNLKDLTEANAIRLKNVFERRGFKQPLNLWKKDDEFWLLDGHQRVRVLKEFDMNDNGNYEVPYFVTEAKDETEAKMQILEISSQYGTITQEGFDEFAVELPEAELPDTYFDALYNLNSEDESETEEDEPPEVSDEPALSKLGEAYQLGDHKLVCGDSLSDENVSRLMGGKTADMVFTDPPYNVDYGANKKHPSWKIRSIENDKQSDSEWIDFNQRLIEVLKANSKGDIYVWGASGPDGMRQRLLFVDNGLHWSATIIWKKQQLVLSPAKYQRIYEPCLYGWFDKSSFGDDRKQTEVWDIDRPLNSKEHPTMKPIALCAKGIRNSSNKGDIILDLFGGSGSTLIACEQLERTCYMMELDPKYSDVIRKRYYKFTHDNNEEGWEAGTPAI